MVCDGLAVNARYENSVRRVLDEAFVLSMLRATDVGVTRRLVSKISREMGAMATMSARCQYAVTIPEMAKRRGLDVDINRLVKMVVAARRSMHIQRRSSKVKVD